VRLSVVLPCLDGAETLPTQLEALARQRWAGEWELVIADNGSTDGTLELVERYRSRFPALRVVDASARRGMPHAINAGVRAATGDAVVFCNDDDVIADGWLAAMGEALTEHDLVAGRLEYDELNEPWVVELRGRPQTDELMRLEFGDLPFAFTATIGVSRRLHEAIGGFDEELEPAGDDVDYSWRLQRAGGEFRFVPEAVTHYRLRTSLRTIFVQARRYGEGIVLVYKKHRGLGLPKRRHPWRRGLRAWLGVARSLLAARSRAGVALFIWNLGWRAGMLAGSVKHRVLFL
jgi:GT2 family glycosyltransferase